MPWAADAAGAREAAVIQRPHVALLFILHDTFNPAASGAAFPRYAGAGAPDAGARTSRTGSCASHGEKEVFASLIVL